MAALTNDASIQYDLAVPPSLAQIRIGIATTIYRGSLVHAHFGLATNQPLETEHFIGVAWQRVTNASIGQLITIAVTGRFKFSCVNFTDTNYGELFAVNTLLSDNPTDLDIVDFGFGGPVGVLDQVTDSGISGYLNIARRV